MKASLLFCLTLFCSYNVPLIAASKKCRTSILTIPPIVNDPDFAKWLVKRAETTVKNELNEKCVVFVHSQKANRLLSDVGVNPFRSNTGRSLREKQLSLFQLELGATHILLMERWDESDGSLLVKLYEIKSESERSEDSPPLKLIKRYKLTISEDDFSEHRSPFFVKMVSFFTPNSVSLASSETKFEITPKEGYEVEKYQLATSSINILSNFTLGSVEHPNSYSYFDTVGSVSPTLMLFFIDQATTIRKKEDTPEILGPDYESLRLQSFGSCGSFDAIFSVYTPLGMSYVGAGIGPCAYQYKIENDQQKSTLDYAVALTLGHRIFLTSRLFTYFDTRNMSFGKSIYRTEKGESSNISQVTLGLGLYFSDAQNRMAKFFR